MTEETVCAASVEMMKRTVFLDFQQEILYIPIRTELRRADVPAVRTSLMHESSQTDCTLIFSAVGDGAHLLF